ncbi:MAG: hypothetical protein FJ148_14220, partial [Deltaproteobacteria bacterium]|nr:hypothetical protein [Deltaproteobacteria bacterium]
MADGLLEQLIASAGPPLRFLRDGDATQRARTRVPVRVWHERLGGVRAALEGVTESTTITALARLPVVFERLGASGVPPDERGALAAEALDLLEALRASSPAAL